ncbi:CelD/BcsL family acetyltransferase involved in cellulose biosynthesis [Natronocella acetinitrilica]|uniref:CelD/BcsL family acetyltransferase involved in cellulose biosynthesis n=1 Tax=Natronocella acetinitrilica TaxID=414046 RepID=A0AAE3G6Q8_9GAMM|nr:GNAT family N-acetyltransferase [Natronocella acetinitrilica]MCP1675776.1 CelD/BcsL family acetyltransferase involved in cellulose biosynthesis [Natronocella acetinitrilica]
MSRVLPVDAAPLEVRCIRDYSAMKDLAGDWKRLHALTANATPWQSWEWFSSWWPAMGAPHQLCVVVVIEQGVAVLIMPLQIRRCRKLGLPARVLEPVGMPDEINRPQFALGECKVHHLAHAVAVLAGSGVGKEGAVPAWDILQIDEVVPDDSQLNALLYQVEVQGLQWRQFPLHACPYLDLNQEWTAYLASRGRRLAKNLKAGHRKLSKHGAVRLQIANTPEEIEESLVCYINLFTKSWKQSAGIAFAQTNNYGAYYRRFIGLLARQGRARVLLLECGGEPVAGAIAVMDGNTYYGAQIAHDQRFDHCSPGTLLEALELELLMGERSYEKYDFFGGAMNNKRRWADESIETMRLIAFNKGAIGRVLAGYYIKAKPILRRLVNRGPSPTGVNAPCDFKKS